MLFPQGVGLNARLGETLVSLGLLQTLDYRAHYTVIVSAMARKCGLEHRERLLATEGRAFWTELGQDGGISSDLKLALSKLNYEAFRIVILLFGDMLCWTALKMPTRTCPFCSTKFTTSHFFSCPKFFCQSSGWTTLIRLCQGNAWVDALDHVFETLRRWVTDTPLFRASFRLFVLEYENLCDNVVHAAFRW
jgi:hypothetical protein